MISFSQRYQFYNLCAYSWLTINNNWKTVAVEAFGAFVVCLSEVLEFSRNLNSSMQYGMKTFDLELTEV